MRIPLLLALALVAGAAPAPAHEAPQGWTYDADCCSDRDCHPVAAGVVSERADGVHVAGYPVVPYGDRRLRVSKDDADHICEWAGRLLCVYLRPKGF